MQEAKEEVRARLAIEDVVGEYVQLKRAGRNFKGLSPFVSERTPSFVVSPEKQIWHDFSSGRGGDVFSFVMEVEGIEFREALERLARKAGVELADFDAKKSGDLAKRKKRALEANELAARYFQQSLLRNKHALTYVFEARKLNKKTVQEFRIGYAPDDGTGLTQLLEQRGFTKQELSEAGLTNRFGGDLFRGRMMVALMDGSGQVIGFTGRILTDDPKAPKYLNTPQSVIYDKSRHVFGLHLAKESIRKNDQTVIVEGNMDVVSSHQVAVSQVVATAGTALTEWQLKALSRLSGNVALAFDGDKAGLAATERAIPIARTVGVELSIVTLPDSAKDPDELIQQGVELWQQAIASAQPAIDWVIAQYHDREDMSSAAGKRRFSTAALAMVEQLDDPVEVEHYMQRIAQLVDTSIEALRRKKSTTKTEIEQKRPMSIAEPKETYKTYQDDLLALLVAYAPLRSLLLGFATDSFIGEARQSLAAYLTAHQDEEVLYLPEFQDYVKIVELKAENRYGQWSDHDRALEAARLLRQVETEQKKRKKEQLTTQLRDAEEQGDDTSAEELRAQLMQLIKEIGRA